VALLRKFDIHYDDKYLFPGLNNANMSPRWGRCKKGHIFLLPNISPLEATGMRIMIPPQPFHAHDFEGVWSSGKDQDGVCNQRPFSHQPRHHEMKFFRPGICASNCPKFQIVRWRSGRRRVDLTNGECRRGCRSSVPGCSCL